MALNPNTNGNMAGRITAPDANYPYGSSRDETSAGAGDGTPYFKARADDIFGFQQSLLLAASIVPSGNADTAISSQYFDCLRVLSQFPYSPLIDEYPVNARSIGSDGNIYRCLIPNGASTTVVDPVGDVTGTWAIEGGLGIGQSWQNLSASRARGVTYTNTTGATIFISIVIKNDSDQVNELVVDTETVSINNLPNQLAGADYSTLSTIVPDGSNYQWNKLSGADDVFSFTWLELTK